MQSYRVWISENGGGYLEQGECGAVGQVRAFGHAVHTCEAEFPYRGEAERQAAHVDATRELDRQTAELLAIREQWESA